mmetsp:Transcript_2242/g.3725  ORF Transcript_2242/g.3725 Transcript_2242/m.3725 type:complete len:111 (+) Transcript_2242:1299-1631(+)
MLTRERTFRTLHLTTELLNSAFVLGRIGAMLPLEHLQKVLDDAVVKILATEMSVSTGSNDLENTIVNGEERHVESATAEVEHQDVLLARLLVETVGDGSSSRLVDNAHHI